MPGVHKCKAFTAASVAQHVHFRTIACEAYRKNSSSNSIFRTSCHGLALSICMLLFSIVTLFEGILNDVLILVDSSSGEASAGFPGGRNLIETISASAWDSAAPDPGPYSFTNALIEVLQEWKSKRFSASLLHAEILARLKQPRPISLNGSKVNPRPTPIHFVHTLDFSAPSIEISRVGPDSSGAYKIRSPLRI
ncbi:hypothetical protein PG997_000393 [Apiospora hydei]|uniref:Uncharacterized protein n=1 Tax=Apiospora hydei TaxID=1337664 RepID=A0ABR1XAT6_9PEZI